MRILHCTIHRLVNKLIYLTVNKLVITFVAELVSQFMHKPQRILVEGSTENFAYIKDYPGKGLLDKEHGHLCI